MKNKGFSLVELIVVIAIMAILVGVAVPVYSSYIEKANKAKDEQLLGEINSAFNVVCAGTALDINTVTDATIDVAEDGAIDLNGMKVYTGSEKVEVSGFAAKMVEILGTDLEFNVIERIVYDSAKHQFVDIASDSITLTYAGVQITVSGEAIRALSNSTFGKKIGAEKLLNEVAALTAWADSDGNAIMDSLGDPYFMKLAGYMGFGTDYAAFQDYLDTLKPEEVAAICTNGIVLYAAEKSQTLTTDHVTQLLNSGNIYGNLSKDDKATQLAEASMVYGLYTGYVNSDYYTGEAVLETDPVQAVKTVSNDPNFNAYVNSEQGKADLEAYMAAMSVINDSSSNSAAMGDVLLNGYDNDELIALLQQAMGK